MKKATKPEYGDSLVLCHGADAEQQDCDENDWYEAFKLHVSCRCLTDGR